MGGTAESRAGWMEKRATVVCRCARQESQSGSLELRLAHAQADRRTTFPFNMSDCRNHRPDKWKCTNKPGRGYGYAGLVLPRFSVVIPTFDTASMTLGCCRAVLASMPSSTEVIVVDDGSTDGTAAMMPAGVRVVRLETNRGFAAAANRGVAEASGELVLLLNSDAVVQAGALQAFVEAFASDARLGVAGAQLLNEDGTSQWSGGPAPTLAWIAAAVSGLGRHAKRFRRNDGPRTIDWVSGAAMAFRREVWNVAGPLNERYLFYCQDIEFCLRASQAGWNVRVIDDARVVHGLGKTIGGQDREKLRRDLLTWGKTHYGRAWWLFARVVLRVFRRT